MSTGQPQGGGQATPSAPALPAERPSAEEVHRQRIVASLAPRGPLETDLAERVAACLWRLRRVIACERGVTGRGCREGGIRGW